MASDIAEPCTCSGEQLGNETGPYILRPLLDEVSLSADGSEATAKINCVEYYGECHNVLLVSRVLCH